MDHSYHFRNLCNFNTNTKTIYYVKTCIHFVDCSLTTIKLQGTNCLYFFKKICLIVFIKNIRIFNHTLYSILDYMNFNNYKITINRKNVH